MYSIPPNYHANSHANSHHSRYSAAMPLPTFITPSLDPDAIPPFVAADTLAFVDLCTPETARASIREGVSLAVLQSSEAEFSSAEIAAAAAGCRSLGDDLTDKPFHGVPVVLRGLLAPRSQYPAFPSHTQEQVEGALLCIRQTGLDGIVLDFSGPNSAADEDNEYMRIVQGYCFVRDALARIGLPPNQSRIYPAINADAAISMSIDRNEVISYLSRQIQALSDLHIPQAIWLAPNGSYDKLERAVIEESFSLAERISL